MEGKEHMLGLVYEEHRYGGEPSEPGGRWASREDEVIKWRPVGIHPARKQAAWPFSYETIRTDFKAAPGDAVSLVIVRYSDGDTFGRVLGKWQVIGAFMDGDERAANLPALIRANVEWLPEILAELPERPQAIWNGFFTELQDIEVHSFVVGRERE
jgi:hypothetical protein